MKTYRLPLLLFVLVACNKQPEILGIKLGDPYAKFEKLRENGTLGEMELGKRSSNYAEQTTRLYGVYKYSHNLMQNIYVDRRNERIFIIKIDYFSKSFSEQIIYIKHNVISGPIALCVTEKLADEIYYDYVKKYGNPDDTSMKEYSMLDPKYYNGKYAVTERLYVPSKEFVWHKGNTDIKLKMVPQTAITNFVFLNPHLQVEDRDGIFNEVYYNLSVEYYDESLEEQLKEDEINKINSEKQL